MSRLIVGPFNRVEGDLEVTLDLADDHVKAARVNSTLYRGFERILRGKSPADALIYTPRICGICSVSQSMAAAFALAQLQGLTPPENGRLANNIIHAIENIADHLSHFYLFFMPDFAREIYSDAPWYEEAARRFKAMKGTAAADMLPARAELMHMMGILAGKWPHTLSIRPGGSTRAVVTHEIARMQGIMRAFRVFLERFLFGDPLERIVALQSDDALRAWAEERPAITSDFRHFLMIADHLALQQLGRATDRFMSYGAYETTDGYLFGRGLYEDGIHKPLITMQITEDVSHSRYHDTGVPRNPLSGATEPDADAQNGYSWCKAPRLDGRVLEVGALARQVINRNPLFEDLVGQTGGNVRTRVIARVIEIAHVVMAVEGWLKALRPDEVFCAHAPIVTDGVGVGLTEAARGSLGHWVAVERGEIVNYQIIAPTTWNFSPRDSSGTPGALEQALEQAPVLKGETDPVSVQHIVRSFDPCLVCTVH